MVKVLLVEDDRRIRVEVMAALASEGIETEVALDAAGAAAMLDHDHELVVLDRGLPDGDGLALVAQIHARRPGLPVLVLTARDDPSERVRGLEAGADDYVVKPFSVKELLLRIRNVLRRDGSEPKPASSTGTLSAPDIVLDADRHEVTVKGKPVVLTALEFRLLKTFLERPGRVQTRETLLSDVWGIDAEITTRTVDTHIKRLREKLGPSGDIIETIRGVGYKLSRPE